MMNVETRHFRLREAEEGATPPFDASARMDERRPSVPLEEESWWSTFSTTSHGPEDSQWQGGRVLRRL